MLVAAGGEFDPAAWTRDTWEAGLPVLPTPLQPVPFDARSANGAGLEGVLQWDAASLQDECFRIEGMTGEELSTLYHTPYFFQIVEPDLDAARVVPSANPTTAASNAIPAASIEPWLNWRNEQRTPTLATSAPRSPAATEPGDAGSLAVQHGIPRVGDEGEVASAPRITARFTNGSPFLIERQLGRGKVLFLASGIAREWNTLAATPAVVVLDRLCRRLIEETLDRRNVSTNDSLSVLIPAAFRGDLCRMIKPDGTPEPLAVSALGPRQWGVEIGALPRQGEYRLQWLDGATAPQAGGRAALATPRAEMRFAAGSPAEESDLQYLDQAALQEAFGKAIASVTGEPADRPQSPGPWRYLILAGVLFLMAESLFLAFPRREERP